MSGFQAFLTVTPSKKYTLHQGIYIYKNTEKCHKIFLQKKKD